MYGPVPVIYRKKKWSSSRHSYFFQKDQCKLLPLFDQKKKKIITTVTFEVFVHHLTGYNRKQIRLMIDTNDDKNTNKTFFSSK